jgi:Tol biopolymer transport system component
MSTLTLRKHRQHASKVLLVLLSLAGLAGTVRCSPLTTPILTPTIGPPVSTHLGLVYYSERDGLENQGALYLLDLESREERRLTGREEIITLYSGFSWSPVTRKFVYVAGLMGEAEIYTVDIAGRHRQRLTHNMLEESFPSWSPDGTRIAFLGRGVLGESDDTALRAYVMSADGSGQRLLIDDPDVLSGAVYWSPSGKQVALLVVSSQTASGRPPVHDILVIDVTSGEEVLRVADGSDHLSLAWSHNGDRLAFSSNQEGEYELYTVEVDSGRQTKIGDASGILSARWSPDDQWISFTANSGDVFDVYIVQSDDRNLINLTNDQAYDVDGGWSPDGRMIVFMSAEAGGNASEGAFEIYTIGVYGENRERITENEFLDASARWIAW